MADDKISTNVNDNTLNINITSNNQVENNTKPVIKRNIPTIAGDDTKSSQNSFNGYAIIIVKKVPKTK